MVIGLPVPKPIEFMGSARAAMRAFPKSVRIEFGQALFMAQNGDRHPDAKPLRGFGGAGVLEVVDRFEGDTYRAVYTVKLRGVVYVLHAFQKKAKKGIATPREDIELVRSRLKMAEEHYARVYLKKTG